MKAYKKQFVQRVSYDRLYRAYHELLAVTFVLAVYLVWAAFL